MPAQKLPPFLLHAHRTLTKHRNRRVILFCGRAGCARPSNAGALRHHQLRGGPPSNGGTLQAPEPVVVCCTLRAVTTQGAAAVCACSAITRARARGAQERAAQVPTAVRSSLPPRTAAPSGVWATRHGVHSAQLGLTVLDLGRCERCRVASAGMQPGLTDGQPGSRIQTWVQTRLYAKPDCCVPAWRWPCATVQASMALP